MTKAEMVKSVARSTGLSGRAAAEAVDATIREITRALKKENRVSVAGLGTFSNMLGAFGVGSGAQR